MIKMEMKIMTSKKRGKRVEGKEKGKEGLERNKNKEEKEEEERVAIKKMERKKKYTRK